MPLGHALDVYETLIMISSFEIKNTVECIISLQMFLGFTNVYFANVDLGIFSCGKNL